MAKEYISPQFRGDGFNCPFCGVFAHQDWYDVLLENSMNYNKERSSDEISLSYCDRCGQYSVWIGGQIIYPQNSGIPIPINELPNDVKVVYYEARSILKGSPRSAAALLRYGIYMLIQGLKEKEQNMDELMFNLRSKGLDVKIQKALDLVKVTGDNAIFPGQIDSRDDEETAQVLFNLLNLIGDALITQPKRVDEILGSLPDKKGDEFLFRAKIGE